MKDSIVHQFWPFSSDIKQQILKNYHIIFSIDSLLWRANNMLVNYPPAIKKCHQLDLLPQISAARFVDTLVPVLTAASHIHVSADCSGESKTVHHEAKSRVHPMCNTRCEGLV